MKFLKAYKIFEDLRDGLSPEQIEFLNKFTMGDWKYNQDTGLVDVSGSFNCSGKGLKDFLGIRFGKVSRNFDCYRNQLTTLEGSPSRVGGGFYCSNNQLTTLEGSPSRVGGYFWCNNNQLTTLEGSPSRVGGYFVCNENPLKSLKGAPEIIRGSLVLKNSWLNYNLKSFLDEISKNGPELTELLLTHHFITPYVLIEQINKDPHFLIPISKGWNNPIFSEKQEALTEILSEEDLGIIDALWSIGGYL
jgi:hypothetical protein